MSPGAEPPAPAGTAPAGPAPARPAPAEARPEDLAPAVRARGLVVTGRGGPLLDGLDLEVPARGVTALLAPAGGAAGALLRVLLGVDPRAAGEVLVLGLDPARDPLGVRRRVGYAPARPAFYESMSALGLGRFLADVHTGWSGRRFLELLARLGVSPRERVADLAPGPRARLGLAAALAFAPRLLLVEVGDDLDAAARHDLLLAVEDEAAGRAVLLATSRPAEVARLAERVVVLAGGRARFAGAPAELLARTRRLEAQGDAPPALPEGAQALAWRPPTPRRPGELVALLRDAAQAAAVGGARVDLEAAYLALLAPPAAAPSAPP